MNRVPVKKAILTCSYNDSGPGLEKKIGEQAEKEKAAGKQNLNHLILRDSSAKVDTLKFNLLLGGIPLFLYPLHAMRKAGIEEVAVVGNKDTGKILEDFCNYFEIKGFSFVDEGKPEDWSLLNTITKGKQHLKLADDELILICPGDVPFLSIEEYAKSRFAPNYDMIVPFNSKEICGEFFPRNFHYALIDEEGKRYLAKESNALLVNLAKLDQNRFGEELYNRAFKARKSYAEDNPQKKFITDLLFNENGKFSLKRTKKTMQIAGAGQLISEISNYAFRQAFGVKENDDNVPTIQIESLSKLIGHALGIPGFHSKFYPTPDPAALIDVDSFEDAIFTEAMLRAANPKNLYPYFDDLKHFAGSVKSWGCEFTDNWKSYANEQFHQHGIKAYYGNCTGFTQYAFSPDAIEGEINLIKRFNLGFK